MKTKIILLCLISFCGMAQTPVNKTVPVKAGQRINLNFDFPQLVKVSTWDKNEVQVTGTISINEGENDDAFQLELSSDAIEVEVSGKMHDLNKLPHRVTVWNTEGTKMIFKSEAEYKKYRRESGLSFNRMNNGPDIDIVLEIKVPKNVFTKVHSTYGVVEVTNFTGPLNAESTYGAVDAALTEKAVGDLRAVTNYGDIYTNFDSKFSGGELGDFHTMVSVKPGNGPSYSFESKYGNVYLRKAL
jgi:hypothetical protein